MLYRFHCVGQTTVHAVEWAVGGAADRCRWLAVAPAQQIGLPPKRGKKASGSPSVVVRTVRCYHTVDSVGYVLCSVHKTTRGRTENDHQRYVELKRRAAEKKDKTAGREIGMMRKEGLLEDVAVTQPRLAYLLDTTSESLRHFGGSVHVLRLSIVPDCQSVFW